MFQKVYTSVFVARRWLRHVGKDAKLFELVAVELVPIEFIELFAKYGGAKYGLESEDGGGGDGIS